MSAFDCDGIVESVGLRSTVLRLRRFGQLLVIPNDELVSGRIVNESRLLSRRGEIKLSLRLDTPVEKLEQLPHIIRLIIESHPKSTYSFAGVLNICDQCLSFEITYQFSHSDMDKYKRNHHSINLAILGALSEMNIEIAPRFSHAPRLIPEYVQRVTKGDADEGGSASSRRTTEVSP